MDKLTILSLIGIVVLGLLTWFVHTHSDTGSRRKP